MTLERISIVFLGLNVDNSESNSSISGSIFPKILKVPFISFLLYILVNESRISKSSKGSSLDLKY